jgi:hypothetical protein
VEAACRKRGRRHAEVPLSFCDNVYVNINSVKIAPKHIKKEMFMKFGGVIDRHI